MLRAALAIQGMTEPRKQHVISFKWTSCLDRVGGMKELGFEGCVGVCHLEKVEGNAGQIEHVAQKQGSGGE